MSRISIDVTPQQHKRLKAMAALRGKSIKEFVLERTLAPIQSEADEEKALEELESLLDERMRNSESSGVSEQSVEEIFQDVHRNAES